ncbi:MAG TPA: histidine kinase [Verrucomicrobiae bacterium]|nr:histidine kinase [Verrucomicrobiae bacterium]
MSARAGRGRAAGWRRGGLRRQVLFVMLAVSVVPLAIFSVASLTALEGLNSGALRSADRGLVAEQDAHLAELVQARAATVNEDLVSIQDELSMLRGEAERSLIPAPAGGGGGSQLASESDLVTEPGARVTGSGGLAAVMPLLGPSMALVTQLHPEVADVWLRAGPYLQVAPVGAVGRAAPFAHAAVLPLPGIVQTAVRRQMLGLQPPYVWRRLVGEETPQLVWSRVYDNPLVGGPTVTVITQDHSAAGTPFTLGADIPVHNLAVQFLSSPPAATHGAYAFLISSDGRLLSVAGTGRVALGLPRNWTGQSPVRLAAGRPTLAPVAEAMTLGLAGEARVRLGGVPTSLFYAPLPTSEWSLGVAAPTQALQASVLLLSGRIRSGLTSTMALLVPFVIALAVLVAVIAGTFARRALRPLVALTVASGRIAEGDLETPVAVSERRDEIGRLERTLERMRRRLFVQRREIEGGRRQLERRVERRTQELRDRNQELGMLYTLATELGRSLMVADVAQTAADYLAQVLHLQGAAVYCLDSLQPPPGRVAGRAGAAPGEAVLPPGWPAWTGPAGEAGTVRGPWLLIPLDSGGARLGGLALDRGHDGAVAPRQLELLQVVGGQLALALRNAQLFADSQELGTLNERNRLAREIHDTLAQGLAGIVTQLQGAEGWLDRDPDRSRAALRQATELARRNLQEARRSVYDLRPEALQRNGLVGALREELARVRTDSGVAATVRGRGVAGLRLPTTVEVALFRIAQEAVGNAVRHARPSAISVTLIAEPAGLRLRVRDDGIGFTPPALRPDGRPERGRSFGLTSMAERAAGCGGALTVHSRPGRGTVVEARLPLATDLALGAAASEPLPAPTSLALASGGRG